jgi:tripartite ATP-independent transporter DctM subunit
MSDPALGLLMLVLIVVVIMMGFPTAFTLMGLGILFGFIAYFKSGQAWTDNLVFDLMVQRTYGAMTNDVLISIPLFVLMGYVMERGALVDRMFYSVQLAFRNVPAALAVATLIVCTFWGIASGLVGAVVVLMGVIAFNPMLRAGYDVKLASGVITAGGTLGILIPPSILLIVYAATASVSVVKLYAAALIPGFVLAGLYVVYVITRATINPSLCPKIKDGADYGVWKSLVLVFQAFVPLAALIMAVLGSILFGLATPSEAAAMGALGGIILAIIYRAFTWDRLREAVYLTARTSAMVCFLFVGAATFSSVFSYLGGEHIVKDALLALDLTPVQFLLLAQLIIFILGWPLEWSEIIIIFVPIFLPLLPLYGVDPILFGILIAINLQTSFLTPPMAMSAYYLKGVAPKSLQLVTIFKGCMPFVGMVILTLALTYIYPSMVTYLPDRFFNQAVEIEYDPTDESVVDPNIFKNM